VRKEIAAGALTLLIAGCASQAHPATHHSKPFAYGDCITTNNTAGKYFRVSCNKTWQYIVVKVEPGIHIACERPRAAYIAGIPGPYTAMADPDHNVTYCLADDR